MGNGSFTHLMVKGEASLMRRLHGMLEHGKVTTREQFKDLMRAAFVYGKLDPRRLSDDLGYSPSAIYRWIDGKTAPHQSLWQQIVDWILAALDEKIRHREQEEEEEECGNVLAI